jgi:hypothetical protein
VGWGEGGDEGGVGGGEVGREGLGTLSVHTAAYKFEICVYKSCSLVFMSTKRWFDRVVLDVGVWFSAAGAAGGCDCDMPKNHFGECKWVVEHPDGLRLSVGGPVPPGDLNDYLEQAG